MTDGTTGRGARETRPEISSPETDVNREGNVSILRRAVDLPGCLFDAPSLTLRRSWMALSCFESLGLRLSRPPSSLLSSPAGTSSRLGLVLSDGASLGPTWVNLVFVPTPEPGIRESKSDKESRPLTDTLAPASELERPFPESKE